MLDFSHFYRWNTLILGQFPCFYGIFHIKPFDRPIFLNYLENLQLQHFWNVFVVDALLGNFDRHNGNWGFLYHDDTQTATLAPIYDCGSCLLPQADAQVMRAVLSNQDELNARIYRFPTSAIKQNDRKINYYDFLMAAGNKDCNAAVMRMMPRFHLDEMQAFIREVPFLDELQRQFYQTYLSARMERIMVPVHRRIMEQQQHLSPRLHM